MRTFVLSKAVMHRTIRARDDSALALHAALGAGKRQRPGGAAPDRKGEACRPARLSPRSPAVATAALAADGAPSSRAPRSWAAWWGSLTQRLVGLSTLPFLLLFAPQLALNARSLHAGAPEALAILSYMSFLTGLLGNTLLLQYFTSKRELSAVLVQAIGIASSFAVLTQIRIAGYMPRAVYSAVAAIVACTATLTALKLGGRLEGKGGQRVWTVWQKVLGLAGLAIVPQVLWSAFFGSHSLLPSLLALGAGCAAVALDSVGRLPPALQNVWGALSAWTATLLFMLQPVSQLVSNFRDPASLAGLSLATIQLAAAGNALMVPRALFTRDVTWLVGSFWGSTVFGWAQMLSMWLGRAPATGARYCTTPHFAAVSALLWGWFAVVAWVDARAKRGSGTAQAELAAAAEE